MPPSSNIAGVVVLYHPEEDVIAGIGSYLPYLGMLYVIDNSGISPDMEKRVAVLSSGIRYIRNKDNIGIAAALNKGATLALQDGFGWLLTMDQDSSFLPAEASAYFATAFTTLRQDSRVAVIAPLHGPSPVPEPFTPVTSCITSGSLVRLSTWKAVGGYDEKLFIDEVDHEFCYRVQLQQYQVMQVNTVRLDHRLGTQRRGGYLGLLGRRSRRIHSPQRVYFMVRNYFYVRKTYRRSFPLEFKTRDRDLAVALKNNLFFSGHFWKTLKQALRGFRDYKKDRFKEPT